MLRALCTGNDTAGSPAVSSAAAAIATRAVSVDGAVLASTICSGVRGGPSGPIGAAALAADALVLTALALAIVAVAVLPRAEEITDLDLALAIASGGGVSGGAAVGLGVGVRVTVAVGVRFMVRGITDANLDALARASLDLADANLDAFARASLGLADANLDAFARASLALVNEAQVDPCQLCCCSGLHREAVLVQLLL